MIKIPEKYKEHFKKIRKSFCGFSSQYAVDLSQPGYFCEGKCKVLYIGINPGRPKPHRNPTDEILLNENTTDDEFHDAYLRGQLNWLFYKRFISEITPDIKDFSIINVCRSPTEHNLQPTQEMVESCRPFLKESIRLINPKNIVVLGKLPESEVKSLGLSNNYNVIYSHHYAYLMRTGQLKTQIKITKELLK